MIRDKIGKEFLLFDGAMGTMILKKGIRNYNIPEDLNIDNKEIIEAIHKEYVESGADIITTNTFGANRYKITDSKYSLEKIIKEAINRAKSANPKYIAYDIGPLGMLLEPMGELSFEDAYEAFKEQILIAKDHVDLILIETITDVYEAKAAVLAAKENCDLPVVCTMSFEESKRTFCGNDIKTMISVLEGLNVDALGFNCSLGPKAMYNLLKELSKFASTPIMVQANAGIPTIENNETVYKMTKEEYKNDVSLFLDLNVSIVGGCCGTTPEYIEELKNLIKDKKVKQITNKDITIISSPTKSIVLEDLIYPVGERINPTGKPMLKEAILNDDYDYILNMAIEQKNEGAKILDVNAGIPKTDEVSNLTNMIRKIQSIIDLPLQIDSSKAKVIESALRIYNGKPIVNSVSAEDSSLDKILPLIKKYGACIIGIALDENGIPQTKEGRLNAARKIVNKAKEYGIDKKDIIIDPLALTVSKEKENTLETLKSLELIKNELGVKTTLGVSNVSFGLPKREKINKTFLAMSLYSGLNFPIVNTGNKEIMECIRVSRLLKGHKNSVDEFLKIKDDYDRVLGNEKDEDEKSLYDLIINGTQKEIIKKYESLDLKALDIINKYVIPALDKVGDDYEKEVIFLPQLIDAAKRAEILFDRIKKDHKGSEFKNNNKIIMATVKGDVHDIGKNIVKFILSNYGYEIIDLGKNVDKEVIKESIIKTNAKLVGLSALMTTTVESMEETINYIRSLNLDVKFFVGGAVLTKELAEQIGADFYAKDAKESVDIAKKFFG
ncbi:homocysteine S-methyltransferase family protein [Peptostreptococcaceae bacterium AGR-M142]